MANGEEENSNSSKRYHQVMESLTKEKKLTPDSSDLTADKNALAVPNSSANDNYAPDSAEASAQVLDKKEKKSHIRINETNLKVIIIVFVFLMLLILISFTIAFSSVFRKQSDLCMERSSYYWYFLYTTFIMVSIMTVIPVFWGPKHGVIRVSSVLQSILILVFIMMCEMLLISRFSFVTFPLSTLSFISEAMALIWISIFRVISFIVLTTILYKSLFEDEVPHRRRKRKAIRRRRRSLAKVFTNKDQ